MISKVRAAIVIPARWESTRFEGKPLARILGKPMIGWVIEGCLGSELADKVIVATNSEKVAEVARTFGADVKIVKKLVKSGTERIAEALKDENFNIVVNVQGDEPLITGGVVDSVIEAIGSAEISTAARYGDKAEMNNRNRVKVVTDKDGFALYFSRAPIPYGTELPLIHIGIYGFSKSALFEFISLPESPLELAEDLEQLRAIWHGKKVKVVLTKDYLIPVDVPEDIKAVERVLSKR